MKVSQKNIYSQNHNTFFSYSIVFRQWSHSKSLMNNHSLLTSITYSSPYPPNIHILTRLHNELAFLFFCGVNIWTWSISYDFCRNSISGDFNDSLMIGKTTLDYFTLACILLEHIFVFSIIKVFITLINDVLASLPFLQTNITSACQELWVAMALLPLHDLIILELSSGSVTQPLGLYSKFSADCLWLIQLGQLLMPCPSAVT